MPFKDKAQRAAYMRAYYEKNKLEWNAYTCAWRKKNKEQVAASNQSYYEKNKERIAAKAKVYYEKNKTRIAETTRAYRERTPEQQQAKGRKWREANPVKRAAHGARYRAQKLKATPAWANEFFLEEAYDLANRRTALTGVEWHVDHIVPLQSKLVCGLHTHHNVRVVPGHINTKKGNRHWPDMP